MRYESREIHVDYHKAGAVHQGEQPILHAYLLDKSPAMPLCSTRPAVIICPGGGYTFKSDREAEPIAMKFLAEGIHAFVLQYSVAPSRYPCAVLELAAAVKVVRENAKEFGVYPEQIYIAGFSAGGHLCATLGTLWDEPVFEQVLGNGLLKNWRPDGMILSYPVITLGEFGHKGSRDSLLGPDASAEMIHALSLENRVSTKTVPAYLWHTYEDKGVPVESALLFATALRRSGISLELHIFEKGVHGLALCNEVTASSAEHLEPDNAEWIDMAIRWVKRRREAAN